MSEMKLKSFTCKGCGRPLEIPRNSTGRIKCPACGTEGIIENLVKNQEIAQKANINSGIPFTAEVPALHKNLIKLLASSRYAPCDVYKNVTVVKQENFCVPGYVFYCNGIGHYDYEAGNDREHERMTADNRGDSITVRTETRIVTEWTQMQGSCSCNKTVFVSGSRAFASIVSRLYSDVDPNNLIDIEELEYAEDVVTLPNDFPHTAAFSEYAKPLVEEDLKATALKNLRGRQVRNWTMSGASVSKEEIVRVFMGIYHVVYTYKNTEYDAYMTADGEHFIYDKVPTDEAMLSKIQALENQKNSLAVSGFFGKTKLVAILSAIIGIIIAAAASSFPAGLIVFAVLMIAFFIVRSTKTKAVDAEKQRISGEIAGLWKQKDDALAAFCRDKQAFAGIWNEVSGNYDAF